MFTIRIAQLNISIDNKYEYLPDMCRDYITDEKAWYIISATDEEIKREINIDNANLGYGEFLAIYRKIAQLIISESGFLMHGVVADVKGVGVAFLAPSGVGKSTHASLWKEFLGDDFVYVNGDKPLVRILDNVVYAYGTPWAGKENLQSNIKTRLKKLCFIKRSDENRCIRLKKEDILQPLMKQIYIPENSKDFFMILDLLDRFIKNIEFYLIECNISKDAAKTSYEVIFNEGN